MQARATTIFSKWKFNSLLQCHFAMPPCDSFGTFHNGQWPPMPFTMGHHYHNTIFSHSHDWWLPMSNVFRCESHTAHATHTHTCSTNNTTTPRMSAACTNTNTHWLHCVCVCVCSLAAKVLTFLLLIGALNRWDMNANIVRFYIFGHFHNDIGDIYAGQEDGRILASTRSYTVSHNGSRVNRNADCWQCGKMSFRSF